MAKSRKKKVKHQDFQKVKLKVGRKLEKAANETTVNFNTRNILIPEQFKGGNATTAGSAVLNVTSKRKLPLRDLLSQCHHYSVGVKHDAVVGVREILASNPGALFPNLGAILERMAELFVDKDQSVRHAVAKLLKFVFPQVPANRITPFFPVLSAHLCCAMTHIFDDIKLDSLGFLDLLLEHYPALIISASSQIMPNFIEQISSRRASGGAGQTASLPRNASLLTNPSSKLGTRSARVKVLGRLQGLLQALVDHAVECGGSDSPQPRSHVCTWSEDSPGNVKPMGTASVRRNAEEGSIRISSLAKGPGVTSQFSSSWDKLKGHIEVLVPILLECWVEVGPSQMASELPDNQLSGEALATLAAVLQVLRLLLQLAEDEDRQQQQCTDNVAWLRRKFGRDFGRYFMQHFPYSTLEMHQKDDKKRRKKSDSSQVSILALNLAVCDVMTVLTASAAESSWMETIVEYLRSQLVGYRMSHDQLTICLRILQKIVPTTSSDADVEELLAAVFTVYRSRHALSTEVRLLLHFLADVVFRGGRLSLAGSPVVKEWLTTLPELLYQGAGSHNLDTARCALDLLALAAVRTPGNVEGLLQDTIVNMFKASFFGDLPDDLQQHVAELLYRAPSIGIDGLRDVLHVLLSDQLKPAIQTYIMEILHAKLLYCVSMAIEPPIALGNYVSVLLSLVTGLSSSRLTQLEPLDGGGLLALRQSDISQLAWEADRLRCEVGSRLLLEIPDLSVEEVWLLFEAFIDKIHVDWTQLPLSHCLSLVTAITNLCPRGKQVSTSLRASLGRVVTSLMATVVAIDTATIAMRIGDGDVTRALPCARQEVIGSCVDCIGRVSGLLCSVAEYVGGLLEADREVQKSDGEAAAVPKLVEVVAELCNQQAIQGQIKDNIEALNNIKALIEARYPDDLKSASYGTLQYRLSLVKHSRTESMDT